MIALLFASAVACRVVSLHRIPGVSGDEAVLGVQMYHVLHHEPYALFTPTDRIYSPVLLALEIALLPFFPPSFALLRAPSAIVSIAALLVIFLLHRRVF